MASTDKENGIVIQLNDLGTPMANVEFTAYKIAALNHEENSWVLEEPLASRNPDIHLNEIKSITDWNREATSMADLVKDMEMFKVTGKTDENGTLTFSDLDEGVYLVVSGNASLYGAVSPFFVAIPQQIGGEWENYVTVNPKAESSPNTEIIEIVQSGDASQIILYLVLAIVTILYITAVGMYKKNKRIFMIFFIVGLTGIMTSMPILTVVAVEVPQCATNVTIENPPDDQYVYQYSNDCAIYQRGQYRFGCGAYDCAPSPIFLLVDGGKYNEASGKTWTANGVEYVPGVSNYELAYCADFDTSMVTDQFYKKVNVEDSTYFESVEHAYKLRAIVGNTYPFVSAVDMVKDLYEKDIITDNSILLNNKNFTDELNTSDIDVGQLIAATQMAVWVVCNDTMNSASVTAGRYTYYTLHPDNTSMRPEGKLNPVKGYPNANDETTTKFPMTEGQAANINAIYQYLMGLEPITEEEADRNQQLVITDVDYEATKAGTENYHITVKVRLNTAIKKNDNLTMKVIASQANGEGNPIETLKVFQNQGSGEVIGKEFVLELKDVPADSTITIELSGEQYLNRGVYFYEPFVAEGETERSTSQNLVGASVGYTPVSATASFQVEDAQTVAVMPETGGIGTILFYIIGGIIILAGLALVLYPTLTRRWQSVHPMSLVEDRAELGSLEIPKINVLLPIYAGTDESVLQKAVGHVEGTSLPGGGESTHCVLAAHRGLPSAVLFSNLDQMEEGDVFRIRVQDEILHYQVDRILVVEPHEVEYLQIEEGKDYCTLLTCTPYSINTHRLLVRGHRI